MRRWIMGSQVRVSSGAANEPIKALLAWEGARVSSVTPSQGYPFSYVNNDLAELFYRHHAYSFGYDYEMHGSFSGDDYVYTASGSGLLILDFASNERDLIAAFDHGAQSGWLGELGGSIEIHEVVTRNGTEIANADNSLNVTLRHGYNVGENAETFPRYYFGTEDRLWLPSFWLHTGTTFAVEHGNSLGEVVASAGWSTVATSGTFDGRTFDYNIAILDYLSIDHFTLEVNPVAWWEYRQANGQNPIYDPSTGFILPGQTPKTQNF